MKTLSILVLFLFAQVALAQAPRPRLICTFENGYFRVTDGYQRWEKYIGQSGNSQVECGTDYGIAAAGPYFVTFWQGRISEDYVGGTASVLSLRGHLGVAAFGPYLIIAKAGNRVIEKYVGGDAVPVIESSSSLALIAHGSYLYVTDGVELKEKYIGSMGRPELSVGRNLGAALVGSYLVVYANGRLDDKYIGTRSASDMLVAGRQAPLIALATSNYFIVYDAQRNTMKDTYIGASGRVEVRPDGAYHFSANNRVSRYDLLNGDFRSL